MKKYLGLFLVILLLSCTKEISNIGENLLLGGLFERGTHSIDIKINNNPYGNDSLITGGIANISLGEYKFENLGGLKSELVTRLNFSGELKSFFGDEIVDSVKLHMPFLGIDSSSYFPDKIKKLGNGNSIDLSIYTINEDINDTIRSFIDRFTTNTEILSSTTHNINFDTIFTFTEASTIKETPRIKMNLDTKFWQDVIDNYSNKVVNTVKFNEDYKGIKVSVSNVTDRLLFFNISECSIKVYYHNSRNIKKTFTLSFDQFYSSNIYTLDKSIKGSSNDKLYFYGLNEDKLVLDIPNDEIEKLKDSSWLINDASITLNVSNETKDKSMLIGSFITINSTNENFIIDEIYNSHYTPKGTLEKDGNNYKYTINMTGHINSIINNDSSNVKLDIRVVAPANEIGGSIIENKDMKLNIRYSKQPK